jgi:hypothetical protein
MFTPMNMVINWIFSILGFIFILNMIGVQWVIPAIMANTAPIERT